jgi:HK97 gp10 family phage protein
MKITMKGLSGVQRKITKWEDSRVKALEKVIKETGRAIRKDARRRAPRDTGRLRKGIRFMFKKRKKTGMAGYLRAVAPYSHIIELGSFARNIQPRPFMQPAVEAAQSEYMLKLEYIMGNV